MVKDYLEKRKAALSADNEKRSTELEDLAKRVEALEKINDESENEEELKAAGEELDALKAKKEELEAAIAETQKELDEVNTQIAELDKPAEEDQPKRNMNFMKKEERGTKTMNKEELELRAKEFKEKGKAQIELRATTISSKTVAAPTGADGIVDAFSGVSSIVDLVKIENCHGMGANKVAYVVSNSTAGVATEGSAVGGTEPTFAFVTITPNSYGVINYVTAQVQKQSPLDYEGKIKTLSMDALRAKLGAVITTAAADSSLAQAVTLTALDQKALRNVALNYGGAEGVEGNAWLFLNKADLITLGDVRGTNEKKAVFEIMPNVSNPNVGQIKDGGLTVNYCINSNLAVGTMLYGNPKNIELDLFGDYEVKVSEDYKFAENMLAIRGTVDAGAAIIKKDGLIKVTVSPAA